MLTTLPTLNHDGQYVGWIDEVFICLGATTCQKTSSAGEMFYFHGPSSLFDTLHLLYVVQPLHTPWPFHIHSHRYANLTTTSIIPWVVQVLRTSHSRIKDLKIDIRILCHPFKFDDQYRLTSSLNSLPWELAHPDGHPSTSLPRRLLSLFPARPRIRGFWQTESTITWRTAPTCYPKMTKKRIVCMR
jgi:hypothetical protein